MLYLTLLFSKLVPFMSWFRHVCSQRGHKWKQNMAHTRCMLGKQGYTRAPIHTPTSMGTHTHACTHARAHKHTEKYVIFLFQGNSIALRLHWLFCLYSLKKNGVSLNSIPLFRSKIIYLGYGMSRSSQLRYKPGWRVLVDIRLPPFLQFLYINTSCWRSEFHLHNVQSC
jgi:hypothetical protein